jgi:hypothetical protein
MTDNHPSIEQEVRAVIEKHIGWAIKKDKNVLYDTVSQTKDLFIYHPDAESTIHNFDEFKILVENVFMKPGFKAIRTEIKELRIFVSKTGRTAWFSCRLDDINEIDGKPSEWHDVRWTGVLDKIDQWRIVQEHFSKAEAS